jgi:small conductance mechanosensitive channel
MESVSPYLPLLGAAIASGAILWGAHWFLIARHADLGKERKFPRQIVMLGLTLVCLVAIVLSLPISESSRNGLIGLIGLLASGVLAFSSTTVVANLMAGILLRVTKSFNIGDFIRVGDHFGRVSERGLFDTEIQSESRELVHIPNTYLISHPVTTIRSSGTIISLTLSLGYDVHHSKIECFLVKAAQECGLEEPFVHILELGNHSVTYRISGFLKEVKWLITARSNLSRSVLDALHGHGVEIMSPSYMNQRRLADDKKIIPTATQEESQETAVIAEDIVFDKAEQAEQKEKERKEWIATIEKLESSLKDAPEEGKEQIKKRIAEGRERLKVLEQASGASDRDEDTHEASASTDADKPRQ